MRPGVPTVHDGHGHSPYALWSLGQLDSPSTQGHDTRLRAKVPKVASKDLTEYQDAQAKQEGDKGKYSEEANRAHRGLTEAIRHGSQ